MGRACDASFRVLTAAALLAWGAAGCDGGRIGSADGVPSTDGPSDDPAGDRTPLPDPDACVDVPVDPGDTLSRRLAPWEYANLVEEALGARVDDLVEASWPPVSRIDGLSTLAVAQTVTLTDIDAFDTLAAAVAERVDLGALLTPCATPSDAACPDLVTRELARTLFRRPATDDEAERFAAPMRAAREAGIAPADAAGWSVRALLQAGPFLYRLETELEGDGLQAVEPLELATRLAFLVWGAGPDAALVRAARDGELVDEAGIRAAVRRMLTDPRAEEQSLHFVADWLGLANVRRSDVAAAYAEVDGALLDDMKRETLELARRVLWRQGGSLPSLLTSRETVLTGRLAAFYGLEPQGSEPSVYALPPERMGVLTHGAVLASAGGSRQSMISRGLYVLESVLCQTVPRPPAGLDISDDGRAEAATEREASDYRLSRDTCGACHRAMEPLAHAFEPFDGAGRRRVEDDDGDPLRSDGVAVLSTGETLEWSTTDEFVAQLAETAAVDRCLIEKPLAFALGRPVERSEEDACLVAQIRDAYQAGGETYAALLEAIATHPAFRTMHSLSHEAD